MHDNKPNNFYIKHFFIIFQIKKLQRLFDIFVPPCMYEIVMTATSNRTYYHKVQDHSLPISNPA
jgi:hypothetical protein